MPDAQPHGPENLKTGTQAQSLRLHRSLDPFAQGQNPTLIFKTQSSHTNRLPCLLHVACASKAYLWKEEDKGLTLIFTSRADLGRTFLRHQRPPQATKFHGGVDITAAKSEAQIFLYTAPLLTLKHQSHILITTVEIHVTPRHHVSLQQARNNGR